MQALALVLSLLAVTQLTFAFVTGVGQRDHDVGLGTDEATTVSMTTGHAFWTDITRDAVNDVTDAASTSLIMQTNNADRESPDFSDHDTEQSASPSEIVELEDGGVTEQPLEVVTNGGSLVTEDHESTDLSSSEMVTSAAALEEDIQLTTEGFDGNANTNSDSDDTAGESDQPKSQLKDEEGIKKADEEGQKGEIEGQEEEISTSQATDESDQVLTTIAVDTESTGESDTQATETEALSGLDLGITTEALTDIASTDDYSEIPSSEIPSSQVALLDPEMMETVTMEENGNVNGIASDLVDVEHKLQSDGVHESDSKTTFQTLLFELQQTTSTDPAVDGSTVEEEPIEVKGVKSFDEEEVVEVGSVGTEKAIADTVTETPTTTVEAVYSTMEEATTGVSDSRVATVKTHTAIPNKAAPRGAPWFQSLRVDIVQSLRRVKSSIYEATNSLQKAVEDLQDVMLSFIDGIHVQPRKRASSHLFDDESMEVRETTLVSAKEE